MKGRVSFSNCLGCYSINNTIYYDFKPLIHTDFVIFGVEVCGDLVYTFGSNNLWSFTILGKIVLKKTFEYWIVDMKIKDSNMVSLMDGSIYNILDHTFVYTGFCNIVSSKIISKDLLMFGLYNEVKWFGTKKPLEMSLEHEGRVFYVDQSKWGTVTSGEDRKINIIDRRGIWSIQEFRNYVVKCGLFLDYLYTVSRDGTFKLYYCRKEIFVLETCFLGISDVLLQKNIFLLGLSNGEILEYKILGDSVLNDTKNVYPLFLNTPLEFKSTISDSKSFIFEGHKVVVKNNTACIYFENHHVYNQVYTFVAHDAILNVCITKKNIYLLLNKSVMCLDKKNFEVKREIFVNKPTVVCGGIICTKNGWLINKNRGFKLCNDEIIDVYRTKRWIYCLTESKIYVLRLSDKDLCTLRVCGRIVDKFEEKTILVQELPEIVYYREHRINKKSIKFHKNKFIYDSKQNTSIVVNTNSDVYYREITTAVKFRNWFVCGSSERKIILFDEKLSIKDVIKVDGQVSKIISTGNKLICSTKRGYIYFLSVLNKKIFISDTFKIPFKIFDICYNSKLFVLDSGGNLRVFDGCKEESCVQFQNLSLTLVISKRKCFLGTSDGKILEINLQSLNQIKNCLNASSLSIFSIVKSGNNLYSAGDDHNIAKYNLKAQKIETKTIMSGPIVQLIMLQGTIIALSKSGTVKFMNEDLEIIKEEHLVCGTMNCMLIEKEYMFCFGTSVQKIKI
ncbi:hypothetical protein NGRA_1202 [Nosema granulosis]|uniref:Uncharacterized protein n=1 Tax=Nosema granulosis TaxID=83296 RepID=A0A9P6H0H9_9MICR|nr:hypothetical protein NGRA_1202 [Nosema granulosis]